MISLCHWMQRNYISYLGVIGEPLQMLPATCLFIQLAGGEARALCECGQAARCIFGDLIQL